MELCYKGWAMKDGNSSGRCCCNCEYQFEVMRHPWNKLSGGRMLGPVTMNAGWGCYAVGAEMDEKKIIFYEDEHSVCEMHKWKTV